MVFVCRSGRIVNERGHHLRGHTFLKAEDMNK